ncbi:MAG: class I SAM-dependent methyltransferase [Saprospiraceae bacterium]|nr:class I SAM-dependent methyltransferase [Saprospiraceae bacterium]
MYIPENYKELNKQTWNKKVEYHYQSEFYDVESFLQGKNVLTPIELKLLGDIEGKSILHLQCHFGLDTISLSRMGASVVGVDFSDIAIEKATELATQENANARFIECDVLELDKHLDEKFDIVFTSYGTIGWLDDLQQWARIIKHFLKTGGRLIFAEFHPVVWMFSDQFDSIQFSYFKGDPIIEKESGSYADREAEIQTESVSWNHSISEVMQALLSEGLSIKDFNEYDYSPYNCFLNSEEFEKGKWRITHFENKIPMVYSIVAENGNL